MLEALETLDILRHDFPAGDDKYMISETLSIEQFKRMQHVLLHKGQKRICRAIEYLDRGDMGHECPMPH